MQRQWRCAGHPELVLGLHVPGPSVELLPQLQDARVLEGGCNDVRTPWAAMSDATPYVQGNTKPYKVKRSSPQSRGSEKMHCRQDVEI